MAEICKCGARFDPVDYDDAVCKKCIRKTRLASEGCAACGARESREVFELPIGLLCFGCHDIRKAVMTNIIRMLGREPLSALAKLQEALSLPRKVDKESSPD